MFWKCASKGVCCWRRSHFDKFIKRYSETDPQAEQGPFNDLFGMKDEGLADILGVSIYTSIPLLAYRAEDGPTDVGKGTSMPYPQEAAIVGWEGRGGPRCAQTSGLLLADSVCASLRPASQGNARPLMDVHE